MEDEANVFACLLLMPKELFKAELEKGMDLGDDTSLILLAKKFQVPLNACAFRIQLLFQHGV